MTAYRTSHRFYSAWNYGQEIDDLNRASEQGWQLVKGGCFSSRFRKSPEVRYRYQLDFRKVEDMGRYVETFREQGWEYVSSTFNGWHYFRKLYDPSLPEDAYEIFTDRESLREMRLRWARIAAGISAVLALFAILSAVRLVLHPNLPGLVQTLTFALESGLLLRGVLIMRNPDSSHSRKRDSALVLLLFAVIFAGCTLGIVLTELRPNFISEQQWDSAETAEDTKAWMSFDVRYTDFYYLDLTIDSGSPVTVSLLNQDGETIYAKNSGSFSEEGIRLRLQKGQYQFAISYYDLGPVHIKCGIN